MGDEAPPWLEVSGAKPPGGGVIVTVVWKETEPAAPGTAPAAIRDKQLEEEIRSLRGGALAALGRIVEMKEGHAGRSAVRLSAWAARVAAAAGVDAQVQTSVEVASRLREVGKLAVPDALLRRKGELRPRERELVRRHPEAGWQLLKLLPGFELAGLYVLHHHERFDGQGYPAGLKGSGIPLGARIVAVVDGLEAMLSARAYRPPLPTEEALRRLVAGGGSRYDPGIVRQFVELTRAELLASAGAAQASSPA